MADAPVEIVTVNGIQYYITNKHDVISACLRRNMQWNAQIVNIIESYISKYGLKHFLNVGAHIGTVALPISKHIAQVSAIEAFPKTYETLAKNIELNAIKNVRAYNVAVGESAGTVCFLDDSNSRLQNNIGGMAALTPEDILENRRSAHICNTALEGKMDALDAMDDIVDFDIVLIDIEGMEDKFLKGAAKKLQTYKPILIIEIWGDAKRKEENMTTTARDIIEQILAMGYKMVLNIYDDYVFLPADKA